MTGGLQSLTELYAQDQCSTRSHMLGRQLPGGCETDHVEPEGSNHGFLLVLEAWIAANAAEAKSDKIQFFGGNLTLTSEGKCWLRHWCNPNGGGVYSIIFSSAQRATVIAIRP